MTSNRNDPFVPGTKDDDHSWLHKRDKDDERHEIDSGN